MTLLCLCGYHHEHLALEPFPRACAHCGACWHCGKPLGTCRALVLLQRGYRHATMGRRPTATLARRNASRVPSAVALTPWPIPGTRTRRRRRRWPPRAAKRTGSAVLACRWLLPPCTAPRPAERCLGLGAAPPAGVLQNLAPACHPPPPAGSRCRAAPRPTGAPPTRALLGPGLPGPAAFFRPGSHL